MKTADEFHPGDPSATGYGDVSGIGTDATAEDAVPADVSGGAGGAGERPQDESPYDEDPAADQPADGDSDIYSNPGLELDSDSAATDGVDG